VVRRVQSIVKSADRLRVRDLDDPAARAAVLGFDGADVSALYDGPLGRDFA
jgi:hypothetical protein